MTRSFVQVDLDALNLFPRVAMLAGVAPEHVYRGLLDLWAHCYRLKADALPLPLLRSFFPPSEGLVEALEVCGFIEARDSDVRVKGIVGRYVETTSARAEAGRRGGQKTAAKASREGGRFTKQSPSKTEKPPSNHQATTKQNHQANDVETVDTVTKQTAEGAKQVLGETTKQHQAPTKQTPSKPAFSTKQNQAYPKSNITLSSHNQDPERANARAPEAPTWPTPASEQAAERYLDALTQWGHVGGPPSSVTDSELVALAVEYGDAFAGGIDDAIARGQPWQGWRVRNPLNWLRQSCERARGKAAEERARRPYRPPSYADIAAGADPNPPPPPRDPKRPLSYAELAARGTPRLGDVT